MFSRAMRVKTSQLAGLLLLACLAVAPASGREIIKWVDAEGVAHFGHAATAAMNVAANASAPVTEAKTERSVLSGSRPAVNGSAKANQRLSPAAQQVQQPSEASEASETSAAAPGAQFSQFVAP